MRHLRQWKRILAALGSAAMLVSSVGAVQQTVYAVEQSPIENVSETEEDIEEDDQVEPEDLGDGASDSVVVGGKETDNGGDGGQESGDSDDEGTSGGSGAGAGTESGSGSDGAGAGSGSEGGSGAGDASGSGESGNGSGAGDGSESGSGSEQGASGDGAGDAGTGSDGQTGDDGGSGNGTASGNPEGSVVNEDGSVTWPDGTVVAVDGTKTLPDGTVIAPDGTKTLPDGTVIKPEDEEPGDGSEDDEDSEDVALADSLHVTLETAESEQTDPAMDEYGVYLYTQGENATTTVTIANPDDHALSEDDGAVVRVYMQFKDAVPSDDETVPYKASLPEEGTVAALAMDLSEDERDIALIEELGGDASGDAGSAEDAEDEDDGSEETSAQAENGTDESGVSLASEDGVEGNDAGDGTQDADGAKEQSKDGSKGASGADGKDKESRGETMAVGSYSVTADDGVSYGYTVAEVENGLYCYEFARPINGAEYSVQLTSSYPEGCLGGTNTIWAVALSGDDKAALDTDGQIGVAERPESEDLQDVLRWGTAATVVSDGTTRTQETENYTVTVTYGEDSMIPTDAVLEVTEYATDSAIYQQITEETGETYDWLLDISFYYNDIELEPQAPISIQVKAKDESVVVNEDSITTITHFADTGTEVIENDDVEVAEDEDGLVCTSFELASLSLVAGTTYNKTIVTNASGYSSGNSYLIYKVYNNDVYFLANLSDKPITFKVAISDLTAAGQLGGIETLNATNYYKSSIKGTVMQNPDSDSYTATLNFSNLVWENKAFNGKGGYLTNNGKYLKFGYTLSLVSESNARNNEVRVEASTGRSDSKYVQLTNTYITGSHTEIRWFGIIPIPTEVIDYAEYHLYFDSYTNDWMKANTELANNNLKSLNDFTIARVDGTYTPEDQGTASASQAAVYTGGTSDLPLGFYNVKVVKDDAGNQTIEPLAGVTYTVYDESGKIVGAAVSTEDMRVSLDSLDLGNGKYTMKMTGVPDGYVCDGDVWAFEIKSDTKILSLKNRGGEGDLEGIIVVNPVGNIEKDKTASVYNYENRVYQVDLTAHSGIQEAQIDSLHINFVVDQSNSMLFPSGLKDTGNTITIRGYRDKDDTEWDKWQALTDGFENLDKDQLYYLVVQAKSSSTVMAVWWNGQAWAYQDASYYAKAYYANPDKKDTYDPSKIKTDNTSDQLPSVGEYKDYTNNKVGGGWFFKDSKNKYDIGGSIKIDLEDSLEHPSYNKWYNSNSKVYCTDISFKVYTATNQYNRLHYLEQSLTEMLEMLGTMCPDTTVTLDTFYATPKGCYEYVLGKDYSVNGTTQKGLQCLLDAVGNITTDGGTRQDRALKHAYETHMSSDPCLNKYVILITDGAPAGSGYIGDARYDTANVVIEDGRDSNDKPLDKTDSSHTVYMTTNYWADLIKTKCTLATVGLSMRDVKSGSIAMRYISSDYDIDSQQFQYAQNKRNRYGGYYTDENGNSIADPTHGNWWYQPDDSSELTKILCEDIMEQIVATATVNDDPGQVTDYISDSFYPVDPDSPYKALESGTRINLDGTVCKNGDGSYIKDNSYGKGTVLQDAETKSWYVLWDETSLSGETTTTETKDIWEMGDTDRHSWQSGESNSYTRYGKTYTWTTHDYQTAYWYHGTETIDTTTKNEFKGTIYIKAKEDYIGGNGIDTNGNKLSYNEETGEYVSATLKMRYGGTMEYETPNVNVRLLEMSEKTSMVTVLKGDNINSDTEGPENSVKIFWNDILFGKLVSGKDDVTNKVDAERLGVGDTSFSLEYAGVTLTEAQWTALKSGNPITIPYSYKDKDGNSRDGVVGYFTVTLAKQGTDKQTPDWSIHEATDAKEGPNGDKIDGPYGSNWIEKYTLNVTYTAYKLGENVRPTENVHNGDPGPGTMVDPAITTGVTNGQGVVDSKNIHYVYALMTYELPKTGGSGTLPLQAAGAAMVLAAGAGVYVTRKRRYGR